MTVCEDRLAEQTDELSALLSTIPVGVFVIDGGGAITRTNALAREIWGGIEPANSVADYIRYRGRDARTGESLHAEDWAAARALHGETTTAQLVDIERFDGTHATILNSAAPVHDEHGEIAGAVVALQDVTVQRLHEHALEQELETTKILLDALSVLSRSLSLHSVLSRLVEVLLASGSHARSSVLLWDEASASLELAAVAGEPKMPLGTRLSFDQVSTDMRHALTGRVMVVADFRGRSTEETQLAHEHGLQESVLVPLVWDQALLGLVTVDETDPERTFSVRDVDLIAGIASQATVAVENSRLYEAQAEQARLAEVISRISLALSTSELDSALSAALEHACRYLGAVGGVLARREEGGWRTTNTYGEKFAGFGTFYSDDEAWVRRRLLESREPALVEDVLASPVGNAGAEEFGYRAFLAMPLVVQDSIVGSISYFFAEPRSGFSASETAFFDRSQFMIAASLETQHLLEERGRQMRYAESLNRIHEAVHSTLEFDEIMSRAVIEAAHGSGLEGAAVHLHEGDRWRFSHIYGLPPELAEANLTDAQARLSMRVLERREPVVVTDVSHDERANRELLEQFDIRAVVGAPLFVRNDVVGVLFAGCFGGPTRFSRDQVDFIVKVAYTMSLALENSRLYADERMVARTLQRALLALPERVGGIEFAHAYHSASEAAYVGGDFYDVFELSGGRVGVIIGDVAGKGLEAAVLTSMVKHTIRAHATGDGDPPDRVLELTNEVIYEATPVEAFVTVFFGVLDTAEGNLRYASAGHTTGAIVCNNGSISPLAPTGPLLGAFAHASYASVDVAIHRHEVLFLYTDGLTEARDGDVFYGEERLFAFLSANDGGPGALTAHVIDDVLAFSKGTLHDDLAILALSLTAPGSSAPPARGIELAVDPEG